MPVTIEEAERLARQNFLTPALVQSAADLFDAYASADDTADAEETTPPTERRITVPALQQLLVALGAPLSQQDVVEVLQAFCCAVADAATVAAEAAVARQAAEQAAAPAQKSNSKASRHNTAANSRMQSMKLSRRPTSGPLAAPATADLATSPPDVATAEGEAAADGPGTAADDLSSTAVTLHGMTFPAFVYFLVVFPTLVQHVSAQVAASSAAPNAVSSIFGTMDIAAVFAHVDVDGDGVWSAQDVRLAAEQCLTEDEGLLLEDADLCRLAEMHPVELQTALAELDLDVDGAVTLDDVRQVLQR